MNSEISEGSGRVCMHCNREIKVCKFPIGNGEPNEEQLLILIEHFECEEVANKIMRLQMKIFRLRLEQDKIRETNSEILH